MKLFIQFSMMVLSVAVISAGMFIFMQQRYLCDVIDQLVTLKNDYYTYSIALKKLVREKNKDLTEDAVKDLKKKIAYHANIDSETVTEGDHSAQAQSFLVVNREPRYLQNSAIEFARAHNLDGVLRSIFDNEKWESHLVVPKKKIIKYKKNIHRKKSMYSYVDKIINKSKSFECDNVNNEFIGVVNDKDFLFSWPIDRANFWLSSPFGQRKLRGVGWKFHTGIDMAAVRGTPVKAAASGIIIQSGWNNGYGNCISIAHNKKYKTRYAHLSARYVRIGQKVLRGTVIGAVGDTGFVRKNGRDASHLHFEVFSFGKFINPLLVLM